MFIHKKGLPSSMWAFTRYMYNVISPYFLYTFFRCYSLRMYDEFGKVLSMMIQQNVKPYSLVLLIDKESDFDFCV